MRSPLAPPKGDEADRVEMGASASNAPFDSVGRIPELVAIVTV